MSVEELFKKIFAGDEERVRMAIKKMGKKYASDLEKFLKKRAELKSHDSEADALDKLQTMLIVRAPDKHLHGYLIGLKYLHPKDQINELELATRSPFFKESPTYLHDLAEKFAAHNNREDLYFLRQVFLFNPILADKLRLYYDQVEKIKKEETVDSSVLDWVENIYLEIETINDELQKSYPAVFNFRRRLGMYHLAFRNHFHLLKFNPD